jgi:hypothetical protein
MQVRDVQARVEALLGEPVRWATVGVGRFHQRAPRRSCFESAETAAIAAARIRRLLMTPQPSGPVPRTDW